MTQSSRDPVDHERTTQPFAGESLIDGMTWPGYLLVVAGVIAFAGCLAAFASGHHRVGITSGAVAAGAAVLGVVWVVIEHMRVRRGAARGSGEPAEEYQR